MSYSNVQFKNSGNDEGDVLNFFNTTLRNLVQKNSGDNTFSIVQEDCHDKDFPVPLNTKTKIRLTHSAHTISQIEKGFINIDLKLLLKMEGDGVPDTDAIKNSKSNDLQVIFVGFKDAVEIISEAYFWVDGKLVDSYHQQEMIRESFAYNCIRPRDAKTGVPHSHSLWESVQSMSPNVAGVYIPLHKFEKGAQVTVNVDLVIPFTDQLALQAWRLYPNRALGEMEEEIKFALEGLVWCQVAPQNVGEIRKFWDCDPTKEYNAPFVPITNHFTQIGQSAIIVNKITDAIGGELKTPEPPAPEDEDGGDNDMLGAAAKDISIAAAKGKYICQSSLPAKIGTLTNKEDKFDFTLNVPTYNVYELGVAKLVLEKSGCKVDVCRTNCAGFGLKESVNNAIFESLNEPIIIPAQELTRYQFENHAGTSGFQSLSKSVPLRNATNITMMFPMHQEDYTVFTNIMYENVRLVVNKKTYPETDFDSTWDGRFIQYQLMANELDGNIEPTREFVESIATPLIRDDKGPLGAVNGENDHGTRLLMCPWDNTSFGINFQLERGNAGYVFDGIDTGSHSVTIEFRGSPKYKGVAIDPYLYPDVIVDTKNSNAIAVDKSEPKPPAPEMWICSDTYWTWSVQDGVRYYQRGIPAGYD